MTHVRGEAASRNGPPSGPRDGLRPRVVSAVVLAALALGVAYLGGWPFLIFWAVAAGVIQWEWRNIVVGSHGVAGKLAPAMIGLAGISAMFGRAEGIALGIAFGVAFECLLTSRRRLWAAAGVVYAAALLVACVLLRSDAKLGFAAIGFLFGVVWATDIGGYFVGRAVGGPKLWSAVSPKKTWSGALGGALGAVAAGVVIAAFIPGANLLAIAALALLLSAVSQAGDLFESAVKRRFGVKDASHVIPGHGGVMDRLDGFLAAAVVAALIGVARDGMAASARGLLVW